MKAILDGDIIISKSPAGIQIGPIPSGVGLERLRYDASVPEVVDLANLSAIYVEYKNGNFILHCVPRHPNTNKTYTLVTMTYRDRKNLICEDDGTIRLLTTQEIADKSQAVLDNISDNRSLKGQAKDLIESLTYNAVLSHIDNVFSGLNSAQRTSLKKLYCVVLYLAKKEVK